MCLLSINDDDDVDDEFFSSNV